MTRLLLHLHASGASSVGARVTLALASPAPDDPGGVPIPENRLHLETVEGTDAALREAVRAAAARPSVAYLRGIGGGGGPFRGDGPAEAPHGTRMFWRVTLDELEREFGLIPEPADQRLLFASIPADPPAPAEAVPPEERLHTRVTAELVARGLRRGWWAGRPRQVETGIWEFPLHHRSCSDPVGRAQVSEEEELLAFPSRAQLERRCAAVAGAPSGPNQEAAPAIATVPAEGAGSAGFVEGWTAFMAAAAPPASQPVRREAAREASEEERVDTDVFAARLREDPVFRQWVVRLAAVLDEPTYGPESLQGMHRLSEAALARRAREG